MNTHTPGKAPAHPLLQALTFSALCALLLFAGAGTAYAQWQWLDKDGKKVFSDRSPPADIPEKNILKRPGGLKAPAAPADNSASAPDQGANGAVAQPASAALPATAAKKPASAPVLTGKDAQLQARKKQAEDEEAAKKKAEADKVAAARAENCGRAKQAVAGLNSGVRIATTNAKGEREIMDDKTRAAEGKRLQDIVAADCAVQ